MSHENVSIDEKFNLYAAERPTTAAEFFSLADHYSDIVNTVEITPEVRDFVSRLVDAGHGTLSLQDINSRVRAGVSGVEQAEQEAIEAGVADVPFTPPEGAGEVATTEEITQLRAILTLQDPDLADADNSILELINNFQFNNNIFSGYDPDTGIITFTDANNNTFQVGPNETGAYVVINAAPGMDGSGTFADGSIADLRNMQRDQIAALLDPRLVPLGDGRAVLRGTDQIIDMRTPNFKPIEGTEGAFFDPVTGSIHDDAGNILAKDQFEFQQQVTVQQQQLQAADFEEAQRQEARGLAERVGLAGDTTRRLAQTSATQTGFDLEGLLSEQAIAGRQIPLQGLQSAGTLSAALQQMLDQRGRDVINLSADPGDFIEREFAVRGLQPPEGTEVPLFQDPSQLSGIIEQLANFAGPEFRDPAVLESMISQLFNTQPTTIEDVLAGAGQVPITSAPPPVNLSSFFPPTAPVGGGPITPEGQAAIDALLSEIAAMASPTNVATTSGVEGTTSGTTSIIPEQGIDDIALQTLPVLDPRESNILDPNIIHEQLAEGGTTSAKKFIVGDSNTGRPNPELVEVTPQGTKVTPLSQFQFGTSISASGVDPSGTFTTSVPQHTDRTIQNLPFLQFLKGQTSPQEFGTLSTGFAPGAFGTQLPEAGRVNFSRLSQLMQDPTASSMLDSLLRSGSRSLSGLFNLVRQRAPLGAALPTSAIRT